ncbi:hypothetical protein [Mycobacterium colombiense]|nr:hypothetical protein [Mycobacterium colombiense]
MAVWLVAGAAVVAGAVAWLGWLRGWQDRRALLAGWPVASLILSAD